MAFIASVRARVRRVLAEFVFVLAIVVSLVTDVYLG